MSKVLKLIVPFLLAVLSTFVLASLSHSQFVLHELSALGIEIDFATRLSSSLDDLRGLIPGYGGIIFVALLLGFLIMTAVRKFVPSLGSWTYPLGGGIAILVTLIAMHPIFHITLIAGAREPLGILCQCLAGAFGGWVFAHQSNKT